VLSPTNKLVTKSRRYGPVTGMAVIAVFGSAFLLNQKTHAASDTRDAAPLTVAAPADLSTPFTKIAKQVGPAVVNINTEILPHRRRMEAQNRDGDGSQGGPWQGGPQPEGPGPDNGMQDFFNHFFGGMPNMGPRPQQQEERALGSGFIVDPHGYIVTNEHVIDKADRIYVKLTTDPPNDQGHRATIVGSDKDTDLAVIKIDVGHPLPTVKLGDSKAAQVGDSVEAIGSPFDLSQTVTAGIVSAKNRNIEGGVGGQFKHYIQTDAAINPGNSGGPLLNMDGQVIGVNTALFTQTNGYMGIGFAIPSDTVANVYNQLIGPEHKVVRGSIGITFQPNISSAVAKMYDAGTGVLINSVVPGKAAAQAGLKANDVIVSVDGKPVKNGDDLVDNISARHPGSKVTIGYLRDGHKMTTTCTIDNRADTENMANNRPGNNAPGAPNANPGKTKLGLTVTDLPENAPSGLHGVMIQSVVPGSFGDELNPPVGQGVVIEAINRKPIHNKAEFDAIVSSLKSGDDVVLQIAYPDGGGQTTLTGGMIP
jgi:serine protease Do